MPGFNQGIIKVFNQINVVMQPCAAGWSYFDHLYQVPPRLTNLGYYYCGETLFSTPLLFDICTKRAST